MKLEEFAAKIRESDEIVVFTGAGISTESGIPDFRSPGGIWTRYRPVTFQEYMTSEAARIEAWKRRLDGWEQYRNAKPNVGHYFVQALSLKEKLIGLMGQLATLPEDEARYRETKFPLIEASDVEWVVAEAHQYEARGIRFTGWARPGAEGCLARANVDFARSVARRAERSAWTALETYGDQPAPEGSGKGVGGINPLTAKYLNRLSDLLFILGRVANLEIGGDVQWQPGGGRVQKPGKRKRG